MLIMAKLTGHCFHTIGATAGYDNDVVSAVDFFQSGGNVAHYLLKAGRHMVQRTVGEYDGIFEQSVRIDVG